MEANRTVWYELSGIVCTGQGGKTAGLFGEESKVVSYTATISYNFVTLYEQRYDVSPVYLMFQLFALHPSWCIL